MGQITLVIVEGIDAGRELAVTGDLQVGRDPGSDFVIADSQISSRHAAFLPDNGGVIVRDLSSTNGTFVNGQRIQGSHPLHHRDQVRLGSTVFEVRDLPDTTPEAELPAKLRPTRARKIPAIPVLRFIAGPLAGSDIPVGGPVVIGRDARVADVILQDDKEVSRRHASFSPSGAGLTVQDLGSSNGTFVNGQRITGTVALSSGDQVALGESKVEIQLVRETVIPSGDAQLPRVDSPRRPARSNGIEVENLVQQFGEHRAVDGISLRVEPGEVYGFLGPNGAGKSTTVHMLVTLLPPSSGTARIAGYDVVKDGQRVRATIGVALQAAALDPHLNAWEHMDLQTALQGIPKAQRRQRGQELLERVGLIYAADRRVGGYSGGMARRLDLALALVHSPQVLFLDEPTTGLDPQSRTALWEEVARLVKDEGMTVFLTTQYLEEADVLADRVGIIDHGEIVAENTPANLKAEIGRPTVEVVPLDPSEWEAVGALLQQFGELASGTNKGVAVRLRPGIDDLADVIRALDSKGLRVSNVELHAPTLDDVFLLKTGHSLEGAAEESEPESHEVLEQLSGVVPGMPEGARGSGGAGGRGPGGRRRGPGGRRRGPT